MLPLETNVPCDTETAAQVHMNFIMAFREALCRLESGENSQIEMAAIANANPLPLPSETHVRRTQTVRHRSNGGGHSLINSNEFQPADFVIASSVATLLRTYLYEYHDR